MQATCIYVLQPLCSYGSSPNIDLDLDLLDLIPCGVSMGFGDLLGPGLDGYLISDSLARMNDFPSLSAMGAAYLHGSFIGGFVSYLIPLLAWNVELSVIQVVQSIFVYLPSLSVSEHQF